MKWSPRLFGTRAARTEAGPVTVWEVLTEELGDRANDPELQNALTKYRSALVAAGKSGNAQSKAAVAFRRVLIPKLHESGRTALCFSGGGIRSATLGLGVLQGLASHSCDSQNKTAPPKLLADLDYLSTVSGGGYLGAWFSAWASRARGGAAQVIRELASPANADWEPEPQPLRQLRKFTNYLNPRLGLFSADTWTLVATILRNIVLNWLVLLPLMAGVLAVPRILYRLVAETPDNPWQYLLHASAALMVLSVAYMAADLPNGGNARFSQTKFLLFGLAPLILSSNGFALYWAWQGYLKSEPSPLGFILYGIGIMATGSAAGLLFARARRRRIKPAWLVKGAVYSVVAGAVGGLCAFWLTWSFTNPATENLYDERVYTWLAVPALLGVCVVSQGLLVGLASAITEDEDREWFSRATGWLLISMVCCFGFTGIALMPPVLKDRLPGIHWQALVTALSGWILSGLGGSTATPAGADGTSDQAGAGANSITAQLIRWAPSIVMPVFLVALLALIATFNELASKQLTAWLIMPPMGSPLPPIAEPYAPGVECLLIALLTIPALFLSRFIDANKFSLHAMYRNRLIRTFLGASNACRKPNPFTGFDPDDNLPLAELPAKPLHVINMTLNLVKGENLAWQQRKGESFTATKYRVGSCRVGYQSTSTFAGGIRLGGAVAISGAAANPNMGYASSPLMSVIMMLFNARLGAWLPNPGKAGKGCWKKSGPTYSVRPFVDEAFGLTNNNNAWVNLSDGGHFENLGLYEMVLRRCRTIVVVDGGADPCFHFDDLGNAIRKIYVDMGIAIDFHNGITISRTPSLNARHCAIGTIRYSAVDCADKLSDDEARDCPPGDSDRLDGTLIYIKSSLTGNEPEDVRNYAAQNPTFPHQSTADQWFDESQFEAYRRLGYHIVEDIFQCGDDVVSIADFVKTAKDYCGSRKAAAATAGQENA